MIRFKNLRNYRHACLGTALSLLAVLTSSGGLAASPVPEGWVGTATLAHKVQNAMDNGEMRAGELVHITLSLKLRNKDKLDALLIGNSQTGTSPPPLTPSQVLSQFAPTEADARSVADYLTSSGFTNVNIAPNRLLIEADGTAGLIKAAFKAELHHFLTSDGRNVYANTTAAQTPAHLGAIVLAVHGLQTVHVAHGNVKPLTDQPQSIEQVQTNIDLRNLLPKVQPVLPKDFSKIYGADTLPRATNAPLAILLDGLPKQTLTDLQAFADANQIARPNVQTVNVGSPVENPESLLEWNMDTQVALSTAGGAVKSMILYNVPSLTHANMLKGFNRIVSDNLARAVNYSGGNCEMYAVDDGYMAALDQILEIGFLQGQTFAIASGDDGAYDCQDNPDYRNSKTVDYPAASPYVIAVGGTTLKTKDGGTTWSDETAWSCSGSADCAGHGGGGGVSTLEPPPLPQIIYLHNLKRSVPDISFDASPKSGAYVLVNGKYRVLGGTSLAAPIFTGFWARLQSYFGNSLPSPIGRLYLNKIKKAVFRDVTSGNQGYAAAPGYDFATGWGSLQVGNLASIIAMPICNIPFYPICF
ncbi:S53 family peptidase [Burkholderia diffusa]|uniref:S53 family peptidase n=1 Tax=Burkholderia diffusa TaxID=488732 RepID=UPI000755E7EB|nr:S53 family peptidase [Burkholderia diffusa]KVN06948.1 hypothetical protein WJ62_05705 [Burkholderia diffusa]